MLNGAGFIYNNSLLDLMVGKEHTHCIVLNHFEKVMLLVALLKR